MGGRLCIPGGDKTVLGPHKRRMRLLRALAMAFHRQRGEDAAAHKSRCARYEAWARANPYGKPGIAVVILRQAAALLSGEDLLAQRPGELAVSAKALDAHLRVPRDVRLSLKGFEVGGYVVQWKTGLDAHLRLMADSAAPSPPACRAGPPP